MLREIPRDECAMDFCCKGDKIGELAPEARRLGAEIFHCRLDVAHLSFKRCLDRLFRSRRFDIIHNHLNAFAGFPVWIARRAGIPVITTFHSTHFAPEDARLQRPVIRRLRMLYGHFSSHYAARNSDLVTGVSKAVLERFLSRGDKDSGRFAVTYLGVGVPVLATPEEKQKFRESLGWAGDTPVVLHVGAFKEAKNHYGLISVFEKVLSEDPEACLLMVGDGILRPQIERLVKNKKIERAVRFLGVRNDVPQIMTLSDVFLFPSVHEGLPLAPLEAGAAGLPVVASRIPGMDEAVEDGVTGVLHDVDDDSGMAASVLGFLRGRDLARRFGQNGRARVESNFTTKASADRLLSIYEQCLRVSRGPEDVISTSNQ